MLPIILSIRDDEDRAFVEKLYINYEKKLYKIANKYLLNHHDAEDCVHDTVKLIIDSLDKFKAAYDKGYVEKLLMVTCRNCALNAVRVKRRRDANVQPISKFNYEDGDYEDIDVPDLDSGVEMIYVSEQNCELLRGLIDKLDDKYRDVILLKSLGVSNKAISKTMNITEELVRQRYCRAKKQLLEMGGKDLYA